MFINPIQKNYEMRIISSRKKRKMIASFQKQIRNSLFFKVFNGLGLDKNQRDDRNPSTKAFRTPESASHALQIAGQS